MTGWTPTSTSSTTDPSDGLLEVGRVVKAHGLRGAVVVDLVSNRAERTRPGATFRVGPDLRTLVVETARPLPPSHGGPGTRWLMTLAGVATREQAEALRGTALLAEPLGDADALWVHELVGSQVVADGRVVGTVVAVLANPASDLLELDDGRLVPLRFVTGRGAGRVDVEVPPGLLD